jgi:predicted nuclease with TOPRIM domain
MDQDIQNRIKELIEEEHKLRSAVSEGKISANEEQERLGSVEAQLDQCWDLLRQRRAKRQYGENPDDAAVRPADTVENYIE